MKPLWPLYRARTMLQKILDTKTLLPADVRGPVKDAHYQATRAIQDR